MAVWLYNLITGTYFLSIKLAALFSEKAKLWVFGRQDYFKKLETAFQKKDKNKPLLWMHCASLGEFEQGRTVLETLRKEQPTIQIFLTFFSPSGFEIRKNYPVADWIFYLPSDTASHAEKLLDIVQPTMSIFVKYEFWYHYLSTLKKRQIPTFLIAAIFRKKHPFFQWYGGMHREMLTCFTKIFVQDQSSLELVSSVTKNPVLLAGDTRVDRVAEIAKTPVEFPLVKEFCGENPILVCGSTWPEDEKLIHHFVQAPEFQKWKIILAPHDIQSARIQAIERQFQGDVLRFSQLEKQAGQGRGPARILLIDNIGILSKLYRFAQVAYIGGGFGTGIHNTLEAIAYSVPVIFGPNHEKFAEALWLKEHSGGFSIQNEKELLDIMQFLQVENNAKSSGVKAFEYIQLNQGATKIVTRELLQLSNRV